MSEPLDTTAPDFKQQFEERLKQESKNIEERQVRELADRALKDSFFDGDQFNAVRFVEFVLKSYPGNTFITPMNDLGGDVVYRYNPELGIFNNTGIPFVEQSLLEMLKIDTKTGYYAQIVKHLQVKTYTPPDSFEENPYMVIMRNGAFNILSGELEPFSPDHKAKCRIPVKYDPNAKCETFLKFIDRLFEKKEHITFLQEWFGIHLLKDYRFQRTVILQGDGDNGKSTLLNVMMTFIGPENVSTQSLFRLTTNRFSTAELYGKLANIAADIGPEELKYTGIVKTLTGNDTVPAERKNRDAFSFRNYAKLTFSCNQLPRSPDTTLAFYKRFIVLVTGKPIPIDEQKPDLIYDLTTDSELSGIFNWAYEGLKRALSNGKLSEPSDIATRKELYQNMSDPATGFINNHIIENHEAYIVKQDVYRAFAQYCDKNGFVTPTDTAFYKSLKKQLYYKEAQRTVEGKVNARVFLGLELTGLTGLTTFFTHPENQTKLERQEIPVKVVKVVNSYPDSAQYKEDKALIDIARKYLKNNGGFSEITSLVSFIRDSQYEYEDFKRLKPYTLIFRFDKTKVYLIEEVQP